MWHTTRCRTWLWQPPRRTCCCLNQGLLHTHARQMKQELDTPIVAVSCASLLCLAPVFCASLIILVRLSRLPRSSVIFVALISCVSLLSSMSHSFRVSLGAKSRCALLRSLPRSCFPLPVPLVRLFLSVPCSFFLCHALSFCAMLFLSVPCSFFLCHALSFCAMLFLSVPCSFCLRHAPLSCSPTDTCTHI